MSDEGAGGLSGEPQDPIERLVFECLERIGQDEGAVDEICREHPEHAAALRSHIARLKEMGLVGAQAREAGAFPERLGEFRLIRRIGGGGMGVVFEAEQLPLGRTVALKLVRPENMYFEDALERFQREVAAVARMHHPGIVPIYTVGREKGVPYFAMEKIEGCTLGDVLKALRGRRQQDLAGADLARAIEECSAQAGASAGADLARASAGMFAGSYGDACFRLARQVADALEHAHGRGVLHRDVKPSNIAVTQSGRALLLDFGLAQTREATRLTRTGSQPGSLPYMSPEQVAGMAVDQRTDVYSLGITLYELLTLESPYLDQSHDSTSRRIAEGRPTPIRVMNRAVPWDAETVTLTAMDRDCERRYQTAADFSRDLGNVLERRPIAARRPGPWLRLLRFGQRHPTAGAALLVGLALFVISAVAVGIQQARHARALEEEKEVALDRFNDIRTVATAFLFEFHDKIENLPGSTPARSLIVERARGLLAKLAEAAAGDLSLRADLAAAHVRLGSVYVTLGDTGSAIREHERGLALFQGLPDEPALRDTAFFGRLSALSGMADAHRLQGDAETALHLRREVLDALEQRAAGESGSVERSRRLGQAHAVIAALLFERGASQDALVHQGEALRVWSELAGRSGADPADRLALSETHERFAPLLWDTGDKGGAMRHLEQARAEAAALVESQPENAACQILLAQIHARVASYESDPNAAVLAGKEAVAVGERLYAADASDARYGELLQAAYGTLAGAYEAQRDLGRALTVYDGAVLVGERLYASERKLVAGHQLGAALMNSMNVCEIMGRKEDALERSSRAVRLFQDLLARDPSDRAALAELAICQRRKGLLQQRTGEIEEAVLSFDESIRLCEELSARDPGHALSRHTLGAALVNRAITRGATGGAEAAETDFRRAQALLLSLHQADPEDDDARTTLLQALQSRAALAQRAGREEVIDECQGLQLEILEGAALREGAGAKENADYAWLLFSAHAPERRDLERAVRFARRAVELSGGQDAATLRTLALILFGAGDARGAAEAAGQALALLGDPPADPAEAQLLARLREELAEYRAAVARPPDGK
ncbi:MAG: protein kinase [Planctomycetes bacterium]|nr:protein kinase [Planctomycetota bacterium]